MPSSSPLTRPNRYTPTEAVIVGEHLAELRGRVRLLTWVNGLCWLVIVTFGGLLIAGSLDRILHFDESGTRLIFALAILGGAGWMVQRHLVLPLNQALTGSFLASRVEQRYPGLKNRVVSAVEFLENRFDARLGSIELQKSVVRLALKDLEHIEAADVVEARSIRSVSISGAVVAALTACVVILHPLEALTAVQRLAMPFSQIPWPRLFELELVRSDLSPLNQRPDEPLLIARGDALELYVQNQRGRLPDRVWLECRVGTDSPIVRETLRQTTVRDEKGHSRETAVISWIATRGTMQFRATGGDDHVMPFHRVEVVPPPNVESLQVTVTPPAYSRQPTETLPAGVGHVQGLVGTKIDLAVKCDKVLKSARLRIGDRPGIPLELGADGREFLAQFVISDPGTSSYWFELTDKLGFTDHEAVHYEVRGLEDGVPEVVVENPVADVMLTADAELPIAIFAKDDQALREIRIAYQINDEERISEIPLFKGTQPASSYDLADHGGISAREAGPERQEVEYLWKMADLKPEEGTRIVFRGEATDDYDLGVAHIGKSVPRTIRIGTRDEKLKELSTRVGNLLDDLKQAAQLEQRVRQQTQELRTQVEKVGSLRPQDVDQLHRTEMDQRQATSRLSNPADGVESTARELLKEFRQNRLSDTSTEERLERLADELDRLAREVLPETERALTQAQKFAESDPQLNLDRNQADGSKEGPSQPKGEALPAKSRTVNAEAKPNTTESKDSSGPDGERNEDSPKSESQSKPRSAMEKALAEAEQSQSQTLESLNELQESLAEWRDRRDVASDLESVISEQEAIEKESEEMAHRTMSKSSAELTKQERAELNKLAARQRKVANQLEQFRKQLEQTAESLEKGDADTSEKFSEAGKKLKDQATNSKLQDAAQNITDNKLGAATESQKQAMEELREVERMMKRLASDDTEQLLKQTEEVQQEMQQLRQDQEDLADRAEQLSKQPDSAQKREEMQELMKEQEELVERMAKIERKLERLRLRGPAEAINRSRKRLSEMMKNLREADDDEEMQQAMDDTLDELDQVERELTLEKRIAQERLAFEQLEKVEQSLKSLRSRQESVIDETVRLDTAKAERETLTRGQLKTLKELVETERLLQHEVDQLRQQMVSAEVFALVLKRLSRILESAAEGLTQRETGPETQSLERDVIRKIENLLGVLQQQQKKADQPTQPAEKPEQLGQEPEEQEEQAEDSQPPSETIPHLAQLKLLKAMQEEYLERTEQLEKHRDKDGRLPEKLEAEKQELAREQDELADFARNLIAKLLGSRSEKKKDDASKPNPEPKPELKPDEKAKPNDPEKIEF